MDCYSLQASLQECKTLRVKEAASYLFMTDKKTNSRDVECMLFLSTPPWEFKKEKNIGYLFKYPKKICNYLEKCPSRVVRPLFHKMLFVWKE